ncbi:MAG: hypothetical protein ABIP97_14280 [Chthoniobacterales bacterium]
MNELIPQTGEIEKKPVPAEVWCSRFFLLFSVALAAHLPETSQGPLGWMYIVLGIFAFVILAISLSGKKQTVAFSELAQT